MTIFFFSAAERASPYTLPFFTVFLGVSAFLVLVVNLQFLLFLDSSLNGSVKINLHGILESLVNVGMIMDCR